MAPDYIPPNIGFPIAFILICILFIMVLRDRWKLRKALAARPTLKIMNNGQWVDITPEDAASLMIRDLRQIFDQDSFGDAMPEAAKNLPTSISKDGR